MVTQTGSTLLERAAQVEDQVIALRRDFHAHPEMAYEEVRTAGIVAQQLRELGLDVQTGVAKTGVVGLLRGGRPGRTIALRADMDALPIRDEAGLAYSSTVPGIGHLCGHDAHTAMLIGVAKVLVGMKDEIAGTVKFLFEPAEENRRETNDPGARLMVEAGVLENPKVDGVLAIHVFPDQPAGHVAVRAGSIMAGNDPFTLTIIGREAHSAMPNAGVDAIVVAAQVINALQTIASREVEPGDSVSVHVGMIRGGNAGNTLAERVELVGTVRTSNEEFRKTLPERFERIVRGVTESMRATYELSYQPNGLPACVNDPGMADLVYRAAIDVLGPSKVQWLDRPRLAADTFNYYADVVPGCYWILGTGNPAKNAAWPSHHPRFDIDEEALKVGVAVTCQAVLNFLNE